MSMMKKFNNLFVNEDDFGDEIVEKNSTSIEKQKIKNVKKLLYHKLKQIM